MVYNCSVVKCFDKIQEFFFKFQDPDYQKLNNDNDIMWYIIGSVVAVIVIAIVGGKCMVAYINMCKYNTWLNENPAWTRIL